jgi:NAD(P)-dependent dehydrogenase (short-subunit alcohol dehydrogenase family)
VADGADLYGKRAIVTGRVRGSGSGIGIATARALATREVRLRSPSAADLGREIDQVGM